MQRYPQCPQRLSCLCQVLVHLLLREGLDGDCTGELDACGLRQVIGPSTRDDQWEKRVLLLLGVDGFDTRRAIFCSDLVQSIKQGQDLVRLDPGTG